MNSIELLPVSALRPALYNPREADAERLELVRLSLRKLGFLLPLVATTDGEILSGHQRHAVAVDMGAARVPVLRVDVPEARRRGINILFNRATNDIAVQDTERDMGAALRGADVHSLAAKLPDIAPDSPAFFPCMAAEMRDVPPLARRNVSRFVRHAANVGRMLARLHVHLPIVATPDGTVINGVGRLEAAARKGWKEIAVVTLDEGRAELARAMLNLLSMDFRFTGDNADFLRYGAFRRKWLRRTYLGRAFVLPVYRHKRLSDVRLDEKFMAKWKAACGESVLDFGSGQGDEARMLRDAGIRVTEFEPYPADENTVNREKGRASAMGFLSAVRAGTPFSAIFVSSVLNSVPFPEDREHILRIVAALCGPETLVCAAARGTKSSSWDWFTEGEALSQRASRMCNFPLDMEKGVVLGDIATAPKAQKFFEEAEWLELWSRYFGSVEAGLSDGMVTVRCRKPLAWHPRELAESLRFEFDLPYPDGQRMGLVRLALKSFSQRLGLPLEDV
ncbi:ParB N-terminal domain-containing protein [Desulfovibrio sp.]|uniref:methyltransferase domain-containing protein n=1 Tax=Desulfovibrio sp. TaxID=885 RepID=UPI003AEF612B